MLDLIRYTPGKDRAGRNIFTKMTVREMLQVCHSFLYEIGEFVLLFRWNRITIYHVECIESRV